MVCDIVQTSQNLDYPFSICLPQKRLSLQSQMSVKELHTLELFSSLSPQQQSAFLLCCDCDFLRFICECVANIILGNVPIDKTLLYKFQPELIQLRQKTLSTAVRRKILSSKKGIELINIICGPIIKRLK